MNPWETEPDSLDFEADGLRCIAKRNWLGVWCGYVGIDKDHPWFGLPFNTPIKPLPEMLENRSFDDTGVFDIFLNALSGKDPNDELPIGTALRVHGGITFSDFFDDGLFYYGFDCGHAGDLTPKMVDIEKTLQDELREIMKRIESHRKGDIYRDQSFVVSECQHLAAQLVRVAELSKAKDTAERLK